MASKMLFIALKGSTSNSVRLILNTPRINFLGSNFREPPVRMLYTKVLDKESEWNSQRNVNKQLDEVGKPLKTPIPNVIEQEPKLSNTISTKEATSFYRPTSVESIGDLELNKDADVFGTAHFNDKEDEGDLAEEEFIKNPPERSKRLRHIDYVRLIKQNLNAKDLKGALNILEKQMKNDRVKPETYTYNLLISGCAKTGYTRKAFSLFTKMRQRGLNVTGGTYTSLFNACANAPSAQDGLSRANHLRDIMLEKGAEPNIKTYNAMIKAYGRWGNIKMAYQLADEMKEKKIPMTAETYNFLLQASASDTEHGFRHGLLTWHKMLKQGFKPDYYSFNTILRCTRDCNFGDLNTMKDALKEILGHDKVLQINSNPNELTFKRKLLTDTDNRQTLNENLKNESNNPFKLITSETEATKDNPFKVSNISSSSLKDQLKAPSVESNVITSSNDVSLELPSLLALKPHLGSMLALSEVKSPHERFLLLGGINGFLDLMKQYNITPDIRTFTMMLEVIPPTYAAEKQILSFIRRIGLKADIDFFNVLIKKRSMRFDYEGAKEVLLMIRTANLHPDIVTYGVLALGCKTQEEARELLQEMRDNDIRINIQILGAMLHQGCSQRSFSYICEILQISLDEHIKPNDIFLRHLNKFYIQCARAIDARHAATKTKEYKKQHAKFCDKLRLYYEEHGIANLKLEDAIKVIKEGPYQQYKETDIERLEPLKHEALARKQKIRKYIKKIKISNLRDDNDESNENKQKLLD